MGEKLEILLQECKKGNHQTEMQLVREEEFEKTIMTVRWCRVCGSIKTDKTTNGKTWHGMYDVWSTPMVAHLE